MIPDLSKANIYIICGRTDLRKGIDGLAALVTEEYKMDVFDNALGKNVNGPDKNCPVLPNAYGCHLNSRIIRSFISV